MNHTSETLITLGVLFLLGLLTDAVGRRTRLPRVTLLLVLVFLCGGLAMWLHVSFLLASMVMGCVVANLAKHRSRPFHAIEGIEWPFMILFFILAGASLQIDLLDKIGLVGSAYIIFRVIGRFLGAWIGGFISHAEPLLKRWMGMALLPQAGVALGMSLIAVQRFPDLREIILPVVIASTVLFEVIGPIMTRIGVTRAGEIPFTG